MKKPDIVSVIAVLLIIFVVLGGILSHAGYPGTYHAEGTVTSTGADFSIESSMSTNYTVMAIDNKGEVPVSKLYIFIDSEYVPYCTGSSDADAQITVFEKNLSRRGFNDYERVTSDELCDLMEVPSAVGMGIYIPFGTLPDTVYTGNSHDKIIKWTSKGGTIYWAGGAPGKYKVSKGESAVPISSPQDIFPFVEGISADSPRANQPADTLSANLSLLSSITRYSLSPEFPGVIGMGMKNDEGRCTISAVKFGTGTFFVMGGHVSQEYHHDVSVLISAGVTYGSEILDIREGTFKGYISDSLEYSESNVSVYVLYGGHFPIYGKRIIG